jgi:hypothetical protein
VNPSGAWAIFISEVVHPPPPQIRYGFRVKPLATIVLYSRSGRSCHGITDIATVVYIALILLCRYLYTNHTQYFPIVLYTRALNGLRLIRGRVYQGGRSLNIAMRHGVTIIFSRETFLCYYGFLDSN